MRKNRKVSKRMSVIAVQSMHLGAIMFSLFIMVILNLLAASNCNHLMKSIGEKEKALGRLEDARLREVSRWEEMKTPRRLEAALRDNGMSMHYHKSSQVVRMTSAGEPVPGQMSVARAAMRSRTGATASVGRTTSGRTTSRR